jgi:uncharacterized protein DUF2188
MSAETVYHVVRDEQGWRVDGQGASARHYPRRAEAEETAKRLARDTRRAAVQVHREFGVLEYEWRPARTAPARPVRRARAARG